MTILPSSIRFPAHLALSLIFVGCSLERYEGGGGFETPDLSAQVVDTTGRPIFGARVWLVKSNGDSAPASVLDSTQTDSSGFVKFSIPDGENVATLGLDALERQRMGIAPTVFRVSKEARVELRESRSIQADRDSTGAIPELHVPGSHFSSLVSADGISSNLRVPAGIWDVAVKRGSSVTIIQRLPVFSDTVLPSNPGFVPPGTADTTPLADSANIALDSFRIGGIVQYADTSFHSAEDWIETPFSYGRQFTRDSIGLRLNSNWVDSVDRQGMSVLLSPLMRDTGTLAIQLAFPGSMDTSLVCRMTLYDSIAGVGFRVVSGSDLDSIGAYLNQYPRPPSFVPVDARRFASDNTWYFSWTRDSLEVRSSNGLRGRVQIPERFAGAVRFSIETRAKKPPDSAWMWIRNARIYKPR